MNVAEFFDEVGQREIQLLSGDSWFFVKAMFVVMSFIFGKCTVFKSIKGLIDLKYGILRGF